MATQRRAGILFVALLLTASTAHADPPAAPQRVTERAADPGAHRHDGLYLRLSAAPGYVSLKSDWGAGRSGFGSLASVALGYAIIDNLVVFGEASGSGTRSDTLDLPSGSQLTIGVSIYTLGGGATYYLAPQNVFVSGSIFSAQIEADEGVRNSNWGLGGSFTLGKEWWTSENWGLGVALRLQMASMKDGDERALALDTLANDARWRVMSATLGFSATFN